MYCIICGGKITNLKRLLIGGYRNVYPICERESCITKFIELKTQHLIPFSQGRQNSYNGFCSNCGNPYKIYVAVTSAYGTSRYVCPNHKNTCIKKSEYPQERRTKVVAIHKHPLKPWKDPQSLFCSPRLKEIIGKEPRKGKECAEELT